VVVITAMTIACGDSASPAVDAPTPDAPRPRRTRPPTRPSPTPPTPTPPPYFDAHPPDGPGPDASPVDAPSPIDATFDAGNWIDPLDHGFGADGVALTPDGLPSHVAIDALGRIVIVGVRHGATPDQLGPGYVERRLATGALDPSFDGDGATAAPPHPTSLAVLTDGRIVAGGGDVYGAATDLAYVLDASGARVAAISGGRQAIVALAALPDGGFVAAVEQGVMLAQLVTVRRYRADLSVAWTSGQVAAVTSAGPVTLAAITTGGVERVLITAEGALVSLAAATGAPDGAYPVPAGSWQSPFGGVPLRQIGAQLAMIDRAPPPRGCGRSPRPAPTARASSRRAASRSRATTRAARRSTAPAGWCSRRPARSRIRPSRSCGWRRRSTSSIRRGAAAAGSRCRRGVPPASRAWAPAPTTSRSRPIWRSRRATRPSSSATSDGSTA
jgi:hypothetical protein